MVRLVFAAAAIAADAEVEHVLHLFARDSTMKDVATCIHDQCGAEMTTLTKDGYSADVAQCISPAFSPCMPKMWDCLGDDDCRDAVKCGPKLARDCSDEIANMMSNPEEREKLECVQKCGDNDACIVLKCGKGALDCLDGKDQICYKALKCVKDGLEHCTKPALDCIFKKDGLCNENLKCFSDGAGVCADPAVNMLTDSHIANVIRCAKAKCSATDTEELPHLAANIGQPPHYPAQLACIGLKCQPVMHMLQDPALGDVATCAISAANSCDVDIWDCMGNQTCREDLHCWTGGLGDASVDVWKMLTDDAHRAFDEALYECMVACDKSSKTDTAFCLATKCGPKAFQCLEDTTCRAALLEVPKTALKCGLASVKDVMFKQGVQCAGKILSACGMAGLNIVRDGALGDLVACQAQCTRDPVAV